MTIKLYSPRASHLAPWREFETLANRLGRFWDEPLSGSWVPAVNVEETDDEIVLTAEAPGLSEDDFALELDNNVLTISGEKREERDEEDKERNVHLWERRYGSFSRSFRLPRGVDAEAIDASFDKGVLTVHMPKLAESKTRKIEVKS